MPPDNKTEREQLHELLLENQKLLAENNQLLKKMNRRSVLAFWLRILWFAFIIAAGYYLYVHVLAPYLSSLDTSFQELKEGLQDVPGWKQFYEAVTNK